MAWLIVFGVCGAAVIVAYFVLGGASKNSSIGDVKCPKCATVQSGRMLKCSNCGNVGAVPNLYNRHGVRTVLWHCGLCQAPIIDSAYDCPGCGISSGVFMK